MALPSRESSLRGPSIYSTSLLNDGSDSSSAVKSPAGCYVAGAWSQAGLATLLHIRSQGGGLDVLFDCGAFVASTRSAKHVFISHGHCDHVGAVVQFARATSLNSGPGPVYYVPESCREPLEQAQRAFEILDGSDIPMNLRVLLPASVREECELEITPGGYFEQDLSGLVNLGNGFQIFAFPTIHRVVSQGYCITRSEKGRLLPEFERLSAEELKGLRAAGTRLTSPTRQRLQLAYTGDTTMAGLLEGSSITLSVVLRVPVLILEMTYLDGDPERAQKWGHVHLAEFLRESHRFHNEHIVFVHISERYQPHTKALSILRSAIPEQLQPRISVALRSFGASEDLTPLLPPRTLYRRMIAEAGVAKASHERGKGDLSEYAARAQSADGCSDRSNPRGQSSVTQRSRRRVLGPSPPPPAAPNTAPNRATGGPVLVRSAVSYTAALGVSDGRGAMTRASTVVASMCTPCGLDPVVSGGGESGPGSGSAAGSVGKQINEYV